MSDFELDFDVFAGDGDFQWEENDTRELGDLGHDTEDESLGDDESDSRRVEANTPTKCRASDLHSSSSSVVIQRIEEMVLSFMNQLSTQGRKQSESDNKKNSSAGNAGIKLHLVDRTKANIEG